MKTYIKLAFISVLLFIFTGCDDSTFMEETNITAEQNISFGGVVVDGYISGATVCLDFNTNDECDTNEFTTLSDAEGIFSFMDQDFSGYEFIQIIASGGIDTATNKAFNGNLKTIVNTSTLSQSNSLIINPLTDLVAISFLKSTTQDNEALVNSIGKIAEVLTISATDVLKDPMLDVTLFAKVQQIQHLKALIETSAKKVYALTNEKSLPDEIKKALVTQIQESSDGALKLDRVLDTVEVELDITIAENEKAFILDQIAEIQRALDIFVEDENIDIKTLNRLQLALENELVESYTLLENANDVNETQNETIDIVSVDITYAFITQSIFEKTDAVLDEQACLQTNGYNMVSDTNLAQDRVSDVDNGISVKSDIAYELEAEETEIAVFYKDLTSVKSGENTLVYIVDNSYFSFDHEWINNENNTIYIRMPKDDNDLYGCYRTKLNSTIASEITLTKVYRFTDI